MFMQKKAQQMLIIIMCFCVHTHMSYDRSFGIVGAMAAETAAAVADVS